MTHRADRSNGPGRPGGEEVAPAPPTDAPIAADHHNQCGRAPTEKLMVEVLWTGSVEAPIIRGSRPRAAAAPGRTRRAARPATLPEPWDEGEHQIDVAVGPWNRCRSGGP